MHNRNLRDTWRGRIVEHTPGCLGGEGGGLGWVGAEAAPPDQCSGLETIQVIHCSEGGTMCYLLLQAIAACSDYVEGGTITSIADTPFHPRNSCH